MTKVVYVAIVLDDESMEKCHLMDPYHHKKSYGHHCTLACGRAVKDGHLKLLGKTVELKCRMIVGDMNCSAVGLEPVQMCSNAHPHVTLSCGDGVSPVYSNSLFDEPEVVNKVDDVLHGTVMAFMDDGTWTSDPPVGL